MQERTPLVRRRAVAVRVVLIAVLAAVAVGAARAAHTARPSKTAARVSVASLRGLVRDYRNVTWTFERAAHRPLHQSTFGEAKTKSRAYLRWSVDLWTRRAYVAQAEALQAITTKLAIGLPAPPALRARLWTRIAYSRRLTLALGRIYPGRSASRSLASAAPSGKRTLRFWQQRSALAALAVSRHGVRQARIPAWLEHDFQCIHGYEASWTADTGNGYYGGLQMDLTFQRLYGQPYVRRYGTADRWPVWAQLEVAARAFRSGRGFWPWPNTARACGLL